MKLRTLVHVPDVFEARDARTENRKREKKRYDSLITLSADDPGKARLLDEGAVVYADGNIDFYIEKGTLKKYLDALPGDYRGYINLGHLPFAEFPFKLGEWRKSDMELVDIGDGRQAIDIQLHLYEDSPFVQALKAQPFKPGLSAEFAFDGEYKEVRVGDDEYEPVLCISELFITEFAIVGECGNVNSSDIDLKGGEDLGKLKELFKTLVEEKETEESVEEETVEEDAETEDKNFSDEMSEDSEEADVSEDTEFSDNEEEGDMEEVLDTISALKEENEALKSENAELSARVGEMEKEINDFVADFKELTVTLNPNLAKKEETVEEPTSRYKGSDGIGEL